MNEEESVLGLLYKEFDDEQQQLTVALAQGQPKDFAEYRFLCGKLHSFAVAKAIINDMVERLRKQAE